MPIKWTPEADAKLLLGILHVYDIKMSGDKLEQLNAFMGPECSGQSIPLHVLRLKKAAAAIGTNGTNGSAPATPKTPRSTKGGTKRKNMPGEDALSDDQESPIKKKAKSKTPKLKAPVDESESEERVRMPWGEIKQEASFFDDEVDAEGLGDDVV
ncbi:hypothetical protein GTA08_BOTSDO04739 [Botryosphaeria dothidea]|uniref:Uncharacterized protein n=1 Tax=Botryosphaeria dothidea TaxID=55169 RepID=A0A8H4IXR0_9PEZI|nr:hypothetical protein GTA08_BOTSDO04739 [Botryosphaeria dothidea]